VLQVLRSESPRFVSGVQARRSKSQNEALSAPPQRLIAMDLDRNRYFMFGVILFLLGLQFRLVDSFVLNESSTRVLHKIAQRSKIADGNVATNVYMQVGAPKKSLRPPHWLGFVLLTVGGVMSLHAMVLPRRQ
jgi:hypothetical protein